MAVAIVFAAATATPTRAENTSVIPSCAAWQLKTSFPAPEVYGAAATSNNSDLAWIAGGYSLQTGAVTTAFRRYNLGSNSWTTLAPMPDAVLGASAVYSPITNKIYVFGGFNPSGSGTFSNATRIYDIASNAWSAGAVMPQPRNYMAAGEYNAKIYLVGGYQGASANTARTQVWEYDFLANTWNTSRQSMPAAIGGAGFGIINGHLYVAGGRNEPIFNPNLNSLYDYDIGTNQWIQRANLPAGTSFPGSGAVEGKLALFGGENGSYTKNSLFYDPVSNTWSSGPTLSTGRSYIAGTAIGATLFAAGGYTGSTSVNTTETSGCGVCGWTSATAYPIGIRYNGAAALGGALYSVGGVSGATHFPSVYKFDGMAWTQMQDLPEPLYGAGVVSNDAYCYVINGASGSNVSHKNLYRFSPSEGYTALAQSPTATHFFGAVFLNGKIYKIAGLISTFHAPFNILELSDKVEAYDIFENKWSTKAPYPIAIAGVSAFTYNGYIYATGGSYLDNGSTPDSVKTYRYDPGTDTWSDAGIADLPVSRSFATVAHYDGGGVLAGGYVGGSFNSNISASTILWDPVTNAWSNLPNLPQARQGGGGAVVNGNLHVVGGLSTADQYTTDNQRLTCPSSCLTTIFSENFDGVTAPALPAGWAASSVEGSLLWVTSTSTPYTGPNAAFIDDLNHSGYYYHDQRLDTILIAIPPSAAAQLSFHNMYFLGYSRAFDLSYSYYAGGVLEVSSPNINGGAFTDITNATVGGRFERGGYNAIVSATYVLDGRQAWAGITGITSSSGYINTVVNLGPNLAGQNIKLRFRLGRIDGDARYASQGWWVDDLAITAPCVPTPELAVSRKSHNGINFDVALPLSGNVGIECRSGGASGDHQVVIYFPSPVTLGATPTLSGIGSVGSLNTTSNRVTVNLTGVANAQRITLRLPNVNDGMNRGDVFIPIGILAGDTSGNGSANSSDVSQTKSRSGQAVTSANFRSDLNFSGAINSSDVSFVKSKTGTGLP